jgi:hypothetical protein
MQGVAATWAAVAREEFNSWDALLAEIDFRFIDANIKQKARMSLKVLRMNETDEGLQNCANRFDELAGQAELADADMHGELFMGLLSLAMSHKQDDFEPTNKR